MWGSFLNVLALDLLADRSTIKFRRSACPHCFAHLAWHDLVPVLSYIILKGRCRFCNSFISILYPCIEVLTACIGLAIIHSIDQHYWFGYLVISSALIVTMRTDLEEYAVSSWMSLYLIPLILFMNYVHWLPMSFTEGTLGALSAYLFLYSVRAFFSWYKGFEGLGLGDVELLAFIGSFLGPQGWWISLLIACCIGSLVGIMFMIVADKDHYSTPIPFCPFIAAGAWIYLFFGDYCSPISLFGF